MKGTGVGRRRIPTVKLFKQSYQKIRILTLLSLSLYKQKGKGPKHNLN